MTAKDFVKKICDLGIKNIIGVPDSTLSPLCNYMSKNVEDTCRHYVPVNEGSAVGMAIGNYLATGKTSCVYMQNSGLGNVVNPITSLANQEVYNIPLLLVIGWRGEPGKSEEPQHKCMGRKTKELLEVLDIDYSILEKSMTEDEVNSCFDRAKDTMQNHRQYALLVKKDFFEEEKTFVYQNNYKS